MANTLAYAVLLGFPLVSLSMFLRFPLIKAFVWTYLGGYLLLPVGVVIDLPSLPDLDRVTIVSLAAALGVGISTTRNKRRKQSSVSDDPIMGSKAGIRQTVRRLRSLDGLIWLFVIGPFLTVLANGDAIVYGPRVLPGLTVYDGVSTVIRSLIALIPFLLARKILVTEEACLTVIKSIAVAGFVYSFLVLWEIRMSPMLHYDLYGFFPHDWSQQKRSGGFRAVVFLGHGLVVALFLSMACIAAAVMSERDRDTKPGKWLALVWWLLLVLVLQKSVGALVITLSTLFMMKAGRLGLRRVWVLGIALVITAYPVVRSTGLLPIGKIAELASAYDPSRARSFLVRIENEDRLMTLVDQRPLVGWGGWGRGRFYTDYGKDDTITDGMWIIAMTETGWIGYIALFGLLTLPLYLLTRRKRSIDQHRTLMGLGLILAANLIDLIPNAGLSPLTWLIAGALAGVLEQRPRESTQRPTGNASIGRLTVT